MKNVFQRKERKSATCERNKLVYDPLRVRMEDYNRKYKNLLNSIYGRATQEYIDILRNG